MYYINELYKKSRPKTFMDYKPGEIPKKPTKAQEPLTLGEVAPKATERATSPASTTTQTRDPFLEGFYSTEDKPETERKTYLQHRTPVVEKVEAKKPEKINLPYRPSTQGQPKITQYGNVSSQNQTYKPRYITNQNLLDTAKTNNEDDEFLQGFNRDRKEESKWNRMLDTVERGVRIYNGEEENASPYSRMAVDVIKAYNTPVPLSRTKEKIENSINDFNALKAFVKGDYSKTDLLADALGWKDFQKEKFVSALNRNNEEDVDERRINDAEAVIQVVGGVLDKVYPYVEEKMLGGTLSPAYIFHEKLENALKAAHYSRDYFDENLPQTITEAKSMGWVPEDEDYCHNFAAPKRDNTKYISLDGGEQIFDKSSKTAVTTPEDRGSHNFFHPTEEKVGHTIFDVAPWFFWGNEPDDSTSAIERGWIPLVYRDYEKKKKGNYLDCDNPDNYDM